jgi:nucleotide-binding universal stress UspA family protein
MKILFAGDEHSYSDYAMRETVKLATNTWADLTLLGVDSTSSARSLASPDSLEVTRVFQRYRELFFDSWGPEESPYGLPEGSYDWKALKSGYWEEVNSRSGGSKDFRLRIRAGKPGAEILAEAREDQSDLIVLGCTKGERCEWEEGKPVPQRIVNDAQCSVLLVKQEQPVSKIRACLDQGYISQESREMVNQMAMIHSAELELIGLTEKGSINVDAFSRLSQLGQYFSDREISVKTGLTEVSEFEDLISGDANEGLLAIWAGKRSLIGKFFPPDWIGRLVSKCRTSVLVMR